jgi:hypothetical protein
VGAAEVSLGSRHMSNDIGRIEELVMELWDLRNPPDRATPRERGDDLISALIAVEADGPHLNPEELRTLVEKVGGVGPDELSALVRLTNLRCAAAAIARCPDGAIWVAVASTAASCAGKPASSGSRPWAVTCPSKSLRHRLTSSDGHARTAGTGHSSPRQRLTPAG